MMLVVGLAVGFRPDGSVANGSPVSGMLLLFGFALSWLGVTAGVLLRHT